MMTALPSTSRTMTLLEQWLEQGVPSTSLHRSQPVKKERTIDPSSLPFPPPQTHASFLFTGSLPQQTRPPHHHLPPPPPDVKPQIIPHVQVKTEKTIDSQSIAGSFGWESIGDIPVPIIFRENERLVPVRVVENKIISLYSNQMPWTVFSCINIRSYYVTQAEASLLNEINSVHSDYSFGYETFSSKDVVVCLHDVFALHSFLGKSKEIFLRGLRSDDWLGFLSISGSLIVPYITKSSKKYVPQSFIEQKVLMIKVSRIAMDEWDCSYLKMLLIFGGMESMSLNSSETLVCVDELQWDHSLSSVSIEECSLQINQMRSFKTPVVKSEFVKNEYQPPSSYHYHRSSATSNYLSPFSGISDDSWMRASTASSPNTTLRSLHQVSTIEIERGVYLVGINLKPYSSQQAVFVADIVSKLFPGDSILTVHHILEKILQVKLYDYSRLHEDAFVRSNYRPLHGDKLILVDVLRKCLPQLKQLILASRTLGSASIALFASR